VTSLQDQARENRRAAPDHDEEVVPLIRSIYVERDHHRHVSKSARSGSLSRPTTDNDGLAGTMLRRRGRPRATKGDQAQRAAVERHPARRDSARRIQREPRLTPTGRPGRAAWPQSPPAMRRQRRVGRPRETPRRRPLTRQTTRARRATARPVTPDSRADPRVGSPAKLPSCPSGRLTQPRRPTRTQPRPTYDAARQTHSPPERSITGVPPCVQRRRIWEGMIRPLCVLFPPEGSVAELARHRLPATLGAPEKHGPFDDGARPPR
jgi:hypothetical protein